MKPENGGDVPFVFGTRFEGVKGSNPEEMIGAALAGCFSMALSGALVKAGAAPKTIKTSADVKLEKVNDAFTVTRIDLSCEASASGVDAAKFEEVAQATKKGCPIARLLTATEIHLNAKLVG